MSGTVYLNLLCWLQATSVNGQGAFHEMQMPKLRRVIIFHTPTNPQAFAIAVQNTWSILGKLHANFSDS